LGTDELFRSGEGAELVAGGHGAHVEVESEEAAVFVAEVFGSFGCELGAGELFVDGDGFVFGVGLGQRLGGGGKDLVVAEADLLRDAVFGEDEVLGSEAFDGLALLVADGDGFDDELGADGEGVGLLGGGGLVLADGLRVQR
jgi:hypothetical protein